MTICVRRLRNWTETARKKRPLLGGGGGGEEEGIGSVVPPSGNATRFLAEGGKGSSDEDFSAPFPRAARRTSSVVTVRNLIAARRKRDAVFSRVYDSVHTGRESAVETAYVTKRAAFQGKLSKAEGGRERWITWWPTGRSGFRERNVVQGAVVHLGIETEKETNRVLANARLKRRVEKFFSPRVT